MTRIVIVSSTAGSVFLNVLKRNVNFLPLIDSVVSDRECLAIDGARELGIKTVVLKSASGIEFSNNLVGFFKDSKIDFFISFYTKIFRGEFVNKFEGKIINFHPSILPSFPGMNGFEEAVNMGVRFIGTTVHFVDQGVDTGKQIIQSARPLNPGLSKDETRHLIYIQQCKMLFQILRWISNDCLDEDQGKKFELSEFSPNLDSDILHLTF